MKNEIPYKEGFRQASHVFGYVILLTLFTTSMSRLFPVDNKTLAPIMFLTLFCFSVLACGLMVLYKPYMLFVDKKGKEAVNLVLATTKWLGVYALGTFVAMTIMSR